MAIINGTNNDDSLFGTSGNDTINGLAGNDTIRGFGSGVTSTAGVDSVLGGDGDDSLTVDLGFASGGGQDTLESDFTIQFDGIHFNAAGTCTTSSGVTVLTHSGFEAFDIAGSYGNDTMIGGAGNDRIDMLEGRGLASGGAGLDVLVANFGAGEREGESAGILFNAASGSITSGGVTVLTHSGFEAFDIAGTYYDDTMIGGAGNDRLDMGYGGRGTASGGAGRDTLGADFGREGAGIHFNSASGSITSGGATVLTHSGFEAFDIAGTDYDDTMIGGAGNDWLDMGYGGRGTASGGAGQDTLGAYFGNESAGILFNAANGSITSGGVTVLTHSGFETFCIDGTNHNDTMTGGAGDDRLDASDGDDTVMGGAGDDSIVMDFGRGSASGGDGQDSLHANFGNVSAGINFNAAAGSVTSAGVTVLTHSGFEAFYILGTQYDDTMFGGAGDDLFVAGDGDDTVMGGAGDDGINMDLGRGSASGGDGQDYLQAGFGNESAGIQFNAASASITSGGVTALTQSGIETFYIDGTNYNDTMMGGSGDDWLYAGDGDDTVMGGSGDDLLYAGDGYDTVIGGVGSDTVDMGYGRGSASGGDGQDELGADFGNEGAGINFNAASGSITSGSVMVLTQSGFETFIIFGTNYNDTMMGGSGGDWLHAGDGNDIVIGGAGVDGLVGGNGNDTYVVDARGDSVIEEFNQGTDTVKALVTWTLNSGVEHLELTGTAAINGTGNELANRITGNAANNDLNGGAGADTMLGGLGNDTYVVDNSADVVSETSALAAEIDTVQSSVTYTLGANLEDLVLGGTAAINGAGNTLANRLTGNAAANTLNGGSGADTLNGGAGADTMLGGLGNDTYIVDNAADVVSETSVLATEIDTVQSSVTYMLGANQENLELTGPAAINGSGNALANRLTGNAAANTLNGGSGADTLNGGAGADTMSGGLGNDTFVVDNAADVVSETSALATEIDTVQSSVSRTLGANQENLVLTGTAAINGTGNTQANRLTGNASNNGLNGGAGADVMIGGLGNDTYVVDNAADVVTETSALSTEIDTVQSSVSRGLGANQENLVLTGTAAINGTGNTLANRLTGNTAANRLDGGDGNDILTGASLAAPFGAAEIDTLTGGTGNDTFILGIAASRLYDDLLAATTGANGYAIITDFTTGDKLQLKGAATQYRLGASPVGLPVGQGLFHDSNASGAFNAGDELIAIIQGTNAANALTGVVVV